MKTLVVWVLIMNLNIANGYQSNAPLVVDNISSRQNCEALATNIKSLNGWSRGNGSRWKCIAVRKVVNK